MVHFATKTECRQCNVEYLKFGFISASSNDQLPVMCVVTYKILIDEIINNGGNVKNLVSKGELAQKSFGNTDFYCKMKISKKIKYT